MAVARQQRLQLTPEQIAEQAKPGWKVTSRAYGANASDSIAEADVVTPEVSTLMRKYFGSSNAETDSLTSAASATEDESALVTMEPKDPQDIRAGRKAVYVANGEIAGEQG